MSTTAFTALRRASPARRAAGTFLIGQAAVVGAALIINVLSARTMGPAGRGQVASFLQISYVLAILALAGSDRAYPITARRSTLPGAVRDMGRLAAPGTALVAAGCLAVAAAYHHRPGSAWMIVMLAVVTAGNCALASMRAAAAAAETGRLFLRTNVAGQISLIAAAGVLAAVGVSSPLAWLTTYALCLTVPTAAAGATLVATRRPAVSSPGHAVARRLGWTVLPGTFANIVALRADRIMLPALGSYHQLGTYIVAATMTELVAWPVQAYVDAHLPSWTRAAAEGALARGRILITAIGYALVAAGAVTIGVRLLLVPLFGPDYRPALPLVLPLAAAAGLYGMSRVSVGLALAGGRTWAASAADLAAMVVSVASYLLLIPHLGVMGAAYGSLAGYCTAAVFMAVVLFRE